MTETTIMRGIVCAALIAAALLPVTVSAQLDDKCVVAILNRTARAAEDGSWVIPNVPANAGRVRARATCMRDGVTTVGQSSFFDVPRNGVVNDVEIVFGTTAQTPSRLEVSAARTSLPASGDTEQLRAMAVFPSGPSVDVSTDPGTAFTTSNPAVISISAAGVMTAGAPGLAIVSASYDGTLALLRMSVAGGGDIDGDGMPDDYERQFNFDPNNPADAAADADGDGLTNLQEYQLGTGPRTVDTDGDDISDGLEVQTGTDPLNRGSFDLTRALRKIEVSPVAVELRGNPLFGDIFRQLTVTGTLLDGRTIDLTSTTRGTTYTSSDLLVCNFGTIDGQLFAGQNGTATVTVAVAGFTMLVPVSVQSFAPGPVSILHMPGYANNVEVLDGFAYVAAGSAGLQVVNVANRAAPSIVASYGTSGRAYDVRLAGNRAYIADGYAGLQIVDIANPLSPSYLGEVDTQGTAQDVWIEGNYAYVADGAAGLQIIDVTDSSRPLRLSNVRTSGKAKGVSVSNGYAVVATGETANALVVVDVRNPLLPVITGTAGVAGEPKDVVARGTLAYIAAYTGGLQIVDFSIPTLPRVVGSLPSSFVPRDVALVGNTAVLAEQLFPHALPFVDVANPASPFFRSIIDLRPLGDYAETGIDLDSAYVYATAEYYAVWQDTGDSGYTALVIAQYAPTDDPVNASPTVRITAPVAGDAAVGGTKIPIRVNATDDERVRSVAVYANGTQIALTRTPPFNTELDVPRNVSSVTLTATAFDFGDRSGDSAPVVLQVLPDPLTNITGIIRDPNGAAVPNVEVSLLDSDLTVFSDGTGRYTFTGLSTIDGAYELYAFIRIGADDYEVKQKAILPVRGGATNVPDLQLVKLTPSVEIYAPAYGATLIGGTTTSVLVTASSPVYNVSSISVTVDGVVAGTSTGGWANIPITVPNRAGTLRIGATATDVNGHTGTAEEVIADISPDPLTTVQGTVVNSNGNPVAGVRVTVLDLSATTGADGKYVINGVATVYGDLVAQASVVISGEELSGSSEERPPAAGGITFLDVTVRSFPVGRISEISLGGGYGNGVDLQGRRIYAASGANGLTIADVSNPAQPAILGTLPFMSLATDVKVTGNVAYVAASSLFIVDVADPLAPRVIGSLPAVSAFKILLLGNVVVALGADSLTAIDVSNPVSPRVVGKLGSFRSMPRAIAVSGTTAVVLEYSIQRNTNDFSTDVHVIDLSQPASPARLGRVSLITWGRLHDVAIRGTRAYITMTGTVTGTSPNAGIPIVDFSNPAAPVLSTIYTQTNWFPFAIAAHGDYLVVSGGAGNLSTASERMQVLNAAVHPPQPVTGLDPGTAAQTAVVLSGSFAYALSQGNSGLDVGACCANYLVSARYRLNGDAAAVRPTVTLVRPQPGSTLVEGSLIPIEVSATDDLAVSSVTITVDGAKIQTINSKTPRILYRIPNGARSLIIGATAADFGGNTGDTSVNYTVVADPRTTASGLVRSSGGAAVPNATVTIGALSTTTDAAGAYTLPGVPASENVVVNVAATVSGEELRGASASIAPVSGGTTNVPNIVAAPRPNGPISSIAAPGPTRGVDVRGKIAFVINGSGVYYRSQLQIIDFSNVEAPVVIGTLPTFYTQSCIRVSGNYAYIGVANGGYIVVDISDLTRPQLSRFIPIGGTGGVTAIEVVGTTLYAGTQIGGRFIIIDNSDPLAPVMLSDTRSNDANFGALALAGRYALTAGIHGNQSEGGFNVHDVTNPRKPVFLAGMPFLSSLAFSGTPISMAVRGNIAYLGLNTATLYAVDFSNPAAPVIVNSNFSMIPPRLAINGTALIAAGHPSSSLVKPTLGVFNLGGGTFTPTLYDAARTEGYFSAGLALSGDIALVPAGMTFGEWRTFFAKYPATLDRNAVAPVVHIDSPADGDRVTEADLVTVQVTATDDVGIGKVTVLANGAYAGSLTVPPYNAVVTVPAGVSTLTVSASATDLQGNVGNATDVSLQVRTDPGTMVIGRVIDSNGSGVADAIVKTRGNQVTTDSTGAYNFNTVASVPGDLVVEAIGRLNNLFAMGTSAPTPVNTAGITNVANIVLQVPPAGPIKSYYLGNNPVNGVGVRNNSLAAFALGCCGLMLMDVSNPYQPVYLSTINLRQNTIASDIRFSGNYAYIAGGSFAGLNIVDISNTAQPFVTSNLVTGNVRRLAVSGTTVYIADYTATGGLKIVDASDPFAPKVAGSVLTNRWAQDVEVSGTYAILHHTATFAINQDPRLSIIDVSNPAAPIQVGSVAIPGLNGTKIAVRGTTVFVAGGKEIQMFDFSNPAVPTYVGKFTPTVVTAQAIADSGTQLVQVGVNASGKPHTAEIINAMLPTLSLAGSLEYTGTPNNNVGVDLELMNEFMISTGSNTTSWPLQTGTGRIFIGKWRN